MKKFIDFLLPYVRRDLGKIIIAILLSLPLAGIKGAQVKLVKYIVNVLTIEMTLSDALMYAGALLGLGILNYPCRFFHFYYMRYIADRTTCAIREKLYEKLQKLPLSYYTEQKSGKLISHLLNDTLVMSAGIKSIIDLVREPLTAVMMIIMALVSDWQLTLVLAVVAPLFVTIFSKTGKLVKHNQEEVQEALGQMTHNINEGIVGQKTIKSFNLQNYVINRFRKTQDHFFDYQMRTTVVEENAHPLVELVGSIAFSGVIVFAYYRIHYGNISAGDFFSFVTALAFLMDPLRKLSQANVRLNQARAAGERLMGILNLEDEKDGGKKEIKDVESIRFENISFSYGDHLVLKNFSLDVKKGEKVALVGTSGSGKSTLMNLLLRMYPVKSGNIFVNGYPLEDISLKSLRNLFGYVGQDIFLFNDTVKENITLGEEKEKLFVGRALEMSCAKDFINQCPDGEATLIGDRGTKLSGGQGQRLTVARALIKDSSVLLFDEATSALDNETEKKVLTEIEKLEKSVIAVAHRLSTVQNFDRIVVLKDGEKIEEGNHQELMTLGGEYAKLYNLSSYR